MPLAPLGSSSKGGAIDYVTARDAESLMWLANMGCIEIHPWLSRLRYIESEDFAVFDLDPAEGAGWEQVVSVAKLLGVALDRLGLRGYAKTSGSRGIHVYVPLEPGHTYGRVRRFVERVGQLLAAADPEGVTMDRHIPNRTGKVFVDSGQNRAGATIASVYSVRPRPGAPVSTPVRWEELDHVTPDDFTIVTVWDRISRQGDLFSPVLEGGQILDHAEEALGIPTC
jgi:bifunctional non-homologous end joining protein LigD